MDPKALCTAIRRRKMVCFLYHAEPRTVHPHAVFVSQDGNVLLSGTEPPFKGWRAFHLDEMAAIEILDGSFTPDPQFDPDSPNYYRIICSISRPGRTAVRTLKRRTAPAHTPRSPRPAGRSRP